VKRQPTNSDAASTDAAVAGSGSNTAPSSIAPELPALERARYERAAAYSAERSGHVVLVARGDSVVFAAGQNGYAAEEPHPLYSASESFWGLLAVAADADGRLDLDEPVSHTFPEFAADRRREDIRLRQLLNFTSGLERGVQDLRPDQTPNLYERSLRLESISAPGDRFRYGSGQLYVFAAVLARKFQDDYDDPLEYLEDRILDPIGLEVAGWERDGAGNPDVAFGARVTAAQWAKLGMLLKNRGSWKGTEIVPVDAADAIFQGSEPAPEYGLTLWLNRSEEPAGRFYTGGLTDMALAAGVGNQRLYVLPSEDLVVVRFGDRDRRWSDEAFLAELRAQRAPAGGPSDFRISAEEDPTQGVMHDHERQPPRGNVVVAAQVAVESAARTEAVVARLAVVRRPVIVGRRAAVRMAPLVSVLTSVPRRPVPALRV
jgi:CubicO group peptidase (beta-lactamase class C family)